MKALRDLAKVDYKWVLLGMGFDVLSYVVQAARWKFLLSPFGKVRITKAIRAVYAGLFANLVFPLRPGELLRSYLLSNSEDISIGRVLGSVGVERLIDLVIAVAALAVASLMVDLPQQFRKVVDTLAIVTLVLARHRRSSHSLPGSEAGRQDNLRRPKSAPARKVYERARRSPRDGHFAQLLPGDSFFIAHAGLPGARLGR